MWQRSTAKQQWRIHKKKKEEHFLTLDWTHLHRRARSGFDLPAWRMSYGARKQLAAPSTQHRAVPSTVQLIAHTRSSILPNFHHNLSPPICHAWHVRNVVRTPNLVALCRYPATGFSTLNTFSVLSSSRTCRACRVNSERVRCSMTGLAGNRVAYLPILASSSEF